MPLPPPITVTPTAEEHVKALLAARDKPSLGVRVGVKSKGCSGLSYTLEYADDQQPFEDVVDTGAVKIFIDPKATLFLIGAEMDYQETDLEEGFTFKNPNEKGRCGCGESFHV